jgi:iron only hydrogenase large subunit-like protein
MNAAWGDTKAPVYTELAECQDCYKCIRKCPVKSIKVEKGQANILLDRCIYCGRCVVSCPAHAKHYRNDVEKVKILLAGDRKVIVSLAPSFVADFTSWKPEELITALKKLGFSAVSETALGADFLSARIARDLGPGKDQPRLMISSACPAIVEYIKLYVPHLTPYISPYASPLLTHARFLRSFYGTETGAETAVVFIGPCIAKKHEADLYEREIDAVITFAELKEWLKKERITPQTISFTVSPSAMADCTFKPRRSAKGAFFPVEGGETTAFSAYIQDEATAGGVRIHTLSVSGILAVQETLAGFYPATLETPLFLEFLACTGGCVNGPGISGAASGINRQICLRKYALSADNTLDSTMLALSPPVDADYPLVPMVSTTYAEQEITEALFKVGKYNLSDRLNCASCGYDTCRDFAIALLDGRAEKSMCASYNRKLANKTANGLIRVIPSGVVIVDRDLKIIDCNEQFACLLGSETEELFAIRPGLEGADLKKITPFPQYFQTIINSQGPELIQSDIRDGNKIFNLTVFAIEKGVTAAGVVEDITTPRVRIETTVERAQEVIKKNASVVQQIAFLLGENAAESEAILNSIIESYTLEKKENA